ncbi:hypothetical protein R3P38DRAFT_2794652 [Favolaschia claudopus]|uniref:Uncharacterized protein n=1 Tax=Favolaschia claudopus TaxID=2862362 RepID=A0AAW0A960_9AGAR
MPDARRAGLHKKVQETQSDLEEYCPGVFLGRWDFAPETARCGNSSSSSSSGPSSLRPIKPFSTLKAPAKQLASSQSSQQAQLDALTSRLQKLEVNAAFSKKCLDELPELYDRVEDMSLKIEDLESALLSVSSGQILSDKDQQTVLRTRDNNINSMLRAVMYSLMGISDQDTSVLPDPVFKGNKISVYWIATDIPDELALRPNFTVAWSKNKSWHSDFVAKVRSQGHALYPSCSQDVINGLSDKDILQGGSRTTFKHLTEKYQRQGKSASEKKIDNQLKRHSRRRNEKAIMRAAVRNNYQSTDHSTDITSASDGNDSLEDDDTPKLSTLKSWPPDYRDPMFIDLLNDIHTRATEFRKKQEPKKKAKGNKQYVYVRAKEKTRVANTIPAPEDGTKMISTFIASDWLDPFHQDKIDRMGQFVYGSDDEA